MIAEIVGVAGTGKTTITQAIGHQRRDIQANYVLKWRYVLPAYYARVVLAVPKYLFYYRGKEQVLWPVIRWMTYLDILHQALARQNGDRRILLDQGPVYWLTYLQAFGSIGINDGWFTQWWTRSLESWSTVLDVIYYLDCDDEILLERIQKRTKKHRLQELSDPEARKFLASYREGYQEVISRLNAKDGPRVRHFSTDRESPDQITNTIIHDLLA